MKTLPTILTRQVALGISVLALSSSSLHAQIISTFGTGASGTLLQNDGDSTTLAGAFVNYPSFSPSSDPNYTGVIGVSALYHEPSANDASVTIFGSPGSVRVASGSGGSFASPSDWNLSLSFNFTSLTPGSLMAGTQFSVIDLDGNSNIGTPVGSLLYNVIARDIAGNVITTPWLTNFTPSDLGLDPTSPGQPSPVYPTDYPTVSESGGVYSYAGVPYAIATPVISGILTQNVTSIQLSYFGSQLDNTQFTFAAVPEPSIAMMAGTLALAGLLGRRRKS